MSESSRTMSSELLEAHNKINCLKDLEGNLVGNVFIDFIFLSFAVGCDKDRLFNVIHAELNKISKLDIDTIKAIEIIVNDCFSSNNNEIAVVLHINDTSSPKEIHELLDNLLN